MAAWQGIEAPKQTIDFPATPSFSLSKIEKRNQINDKNVEIEKEIVREVALGGETPPENICAQSLFLFPIVFSINCNLSGCPGVTAAVEHLPSGRQTTHHRMS